MAGLAACLCCGSVAVLTTPPRRAPEQSLYLNLGLKGQTCESEILPALQDLGCFHRSAV